ncbi:rab GTPase-binding effector protein 1-like isoform X1 [Biomphalaria glabrata]|uniref:Rab GTPase-binding effector protein 1-like isoform X1 n=1 Tax=Biomphalaria glabrata TaxID=6526 RepID=A0A9W2YFC0_BIOGL|nr:rab GTPase-binding effector protein 1-like isoform X1 [Biomphalaria glabrata]
MIMPLITYLVKAIFHFILDELKTKVALLLKEKEDLETDFGLKRAKFRELFLQKENELKTEHEKHVHSESQVKSLQDELSSMKDEMNKLRCELEGVKTAAAMSESNKQEELNSIISNYQQELASLQQLLKEAAETASDNTAARYESERSKLVSLNENYEEEIQELRNKLSQERESFLSTVAKSIKRVGAVGSANTSMEHENLEESMRKAQEDAQILKSVVVPLENEIKTLKAKLKETELKLAESHKKNQSASERDRKSPTLPDLDSITDLNEKVEKLFSYLKAEKAARTDLEMYVAVLSTQKTVLQDEADKISAELKAVCNILEEEKQSHEALKQTWQMANDQFLESQRLMMMDLRRMEGVLTVEQQRQIADEKKALTNVEMELMTTAEVETSQTKKNKKRKNLHSQTKIDNLKLQEKDEAREAQERKVKELEERREKQEKEQEERRKLSQSKLEEEKRRSGAGVGRLSPFEFLSFDNDGSHSETISVKGSKNLPGASIVRRSASSSDISDGFGREDLDDDCLFLESSTHETRSLNEADGVLRGSMDSIEGMTTVRISPEKVLNLPALSAAQLKAITDPTPESEAYLSLVAGIRSKPGTSKQNWEGKRLVSEKEWTLLQNEMKLAREKLGRPCSMCKNYESQLQTVQEELKNVKTEIKHTERSLASEQMTNKNLLKYQTELEEALKNAAEDAQSQISHLTNKLVDCEKYIKDMKEQIMATHVQLQDYSKTLVDGRQEAQNELIKLQEENDSLVDKYSKTAQQLQNEDINLPNNLEDMQLLLLKYREEIISAKVAKEHTEETLRSEIVFLKSQVMGEQQEKCTLEETLTQEISALQAKVGELEILRKELEKESASKSEVQTKLQESENSLKTIQTKSKQLISKMQERLEEMDKRKSKLESENHILKNKVQALQVDLDNSEAVQRDFVKLSQSLQIQLEKIRQAENEVRWQHEDDVEDCNNCRQPFSVTKRKHHCRHCGKIFCSDCTNKAVNSGPNFRPAKVCDVCHTILVKDATPYFSTEPPATPD